jgi:intein/homing endonuclease
MSNNENLTVWQRLSSTFGPNSLLNQDIPTYKFDKKELLRTQNKVEFEREKLQAQQSFYLSNQWAKIDNHLYTQAVYYEPTRLASVYDFESMEYSIAGETNIATPNGFITIKELADKGKDYEFITYAYDHNLKKVVPAKAYNAHYTRDEMTYKITFDDNSYIIATHGHRFLKRDGVFCVVEELQIGDSMMPFYRKSFYDNQNYNWVYTCNKDEGHHGWVSEHKMIAEWFNNVKVNTDEEVHHIDFNGKNNLPENLQIMKINEHRSYHAKLNNQKLWANPEYRKKMSEVARRKGKISWGGRREGINNPSYIKLDFDKLVEVAKSARLLNETANQLGVSYRKIQNELRFKGFKHWDDFLKFYGIKKYLKQSENYELVDFRVIPWDLLVETARSEKLMKNVANKLGITISKLSSTIETGGYKNWTTFMTAYGLDVGKTGRKKVVEEDIVNHKIISIEPYGVVPVYDLTVPGYKNFATDTIFSHNTPEIGAALDIYAEESTTSNEDGHMLQIYSESKRIKSVLTDLFNNVLDINTSLPMWTRNCCKFGDNFVYLKLDPEKGIVGCNQLPNIEIERLEPGSAEKSPNYGEMSSESQSLKFKWKNKQMEFQPWEIAHFRILGDDRKLPYGTSLLEKARRIWKQLLLSEDAMLIYRTSRAPERRVFKVFVGNMDDNDVEAYVQRVANKFKREQIVDSKTGNVDMRFNQMAVDQDYFVPVRDPSQASPIETLAGACISLDTRIPLLDGRVLELSKLIEEWDNGNRNLWAYSCDPHTGDLAPGLITWAGVTRKDTNVLKITLDNGEEVITTPDHKFVHRTNGFVEAQNLKVGDSLMPFYSRESQINKSKSKYNQVWNNKTKKWDFTHRMVANFMKVLNQHIEFLYDDKFILEDKKTIHHLDINRYNNTPSNLVFMNNRDHYDYHSNNINIEHCKLGGQALKNKLIENPKFKEEFIIKASINSKEMWSKRSAEEIKIISNKQSNGLKKYIQNLTEDERKDRYSKNIHTSQSKSKTLNNLLSWCKDIDNLKKKGALISATKQLYENKLKSSQIAKKNWESLYYRDKVFSKPQKLIFNDLLFNIFVEKTKQYNKVNEIITSLNNDENFMTEFSNLNNGIRSSLVNLNVFTHNNLNKLLNVFGYANWKSWKGHKYNNHKIVSIEIMEERMDTGTITIDGNEMYHNYHTFAIESGIFIKNSNLGEIADIEYIQKKLVTALRIPKTFLGFEDVVGDGKTLSLQDIRFARTINRIQKCMISELNKIAIIHLFLLGFEDEISNFTLGLTNPSTQSDLLKIDIWKEKIGLYRDAVSDPGTGIAPVSATWAKKHIFGFSDEEIRLDLQQQRIEKAVGEELKQTPLIIKKTGLFDNIDKLYGSVSGGTPTAGAVPPPSDMGGMDMGGMDMGGMDMGAPPPPPPPGGGEMPPPGEPGLAPESRFDNLNILVESNKINGSNYFPFAKGQKSLGDLEDELKKLLG